jgi:NAD(P)-dependent dehydrogenase (short-subunit alcohol dehydrogenase family)
MMRFAGKRVLITGAATGIGREVALRFGREGAKVMLGDVDERAAETASLIEAAGGTAGFLPTDVSRSSEVAALVNECVSRFGGLEVAFNNAGILPPPRLFHETDEADFDRTIAVDLKGVFNCMKAEIAYMVSHGGGSIINTASVGGIIADPNMAPYVAAKHGVVGLTKSAAIEYARAGIRVNAIGPGLVATPMTQRWLDDDAFREAFYAASPIGRAAEPAEIAGMVLHLASDEASFTNGQLFVIDGGQTAH